MGTKVACGEGGCGACTVLLSKIPTVRKTVEGIEVGLPKLVQVS